MDSYRKYSHVIAEEDLLQVLREAASVGCQPMAYINGEYYTIALDPEKIPARDPEYIFWR